MVSQRTAKEIRRILREWVKEHETGVGMEDLHTLMISLGRVQGNQSFMDSITLLRGLLAPPQEK